MVGVTVCVGQLLISLWGVGRLVVVRRGSRLSEIEIGRQQLY